MTVLGNWFECGLNDAAGDGAWRSAQSRLSARSPSHEALQILQRQARLKHDV
jgi:hypothetical protein